MGGRGGPRGGPSRRRPRSQLVAPPLFPAALGSRGTLRLFIAVTALQPARAYVFEGATVTLRDPLAVREAAKRTNTSVAPLWTAPLDGAGGDALAKQVGKGGVRKLRAKAVAAATAAFRWVALPGRIGDPHGDLQFSLAPGAAFEVFAVDVVFQAGEDTGAAGGGGVDGARAFVADIHSATTLRTAAGTELFVSPDRVTGAGSVEPTHVGALKAGLGLALRARERALARAAGACARGGSGRAPGAPRAWAKAGTACADAASDAEWEAHAAAALGWAPLPLGSSTAPASMLEAEPAKPVRASTRDPKALEAAAASLIAAAGGAQNVRLGSG